MNKIQRSHHRTQEDHSSGGYCSSPEPGLVSHIWGVGRERVERDRVERDWEVGGQDNMHGEKLKMGFFNCRGWHSREVDIMLLRKLDLDTWLAEIIFARKRLLLGDMFKPDRFERA